MIALTMITQYFVLMNPVLSMHDKRSSHNYVNPVILNTKAGG